MRHHQQIPAVMQQVARVATDVAVAAVLARQQVARPGVATARKEGAAHDARIFAGHEDAQRGHRNPASTITTAPVATPSIAKASQ